MLRSLGRKTSAYGQFARHQRRRDSTTAKFRLEPEPFAEHLRVSQSTVRHHTRAMAPLVATEKREYRRANMSDGLPLSPPRELAYLIGVICGDGCIYKLPRTYQLSISCDASYPNLIQTYAALVEKLLGRPASQDATIKGTCVQVRMADKFLPVLLGLPAGAKAQDYPIPEWIWDDLDYVRPFLRGLIETDGNIYHEYRNGGWCSRCIFTAKIESIMSAFLKGTKMLGYDFRLVPRCYQARFTITKEVHRLALELDLTKNRVYIQKPQSARSSERNVTE